jgi:hypothetical protein
MALGDHSEAKNSNHHCCHRGAGSRRDGTYGDSVNTGVDELTAYLTKRAAACPAAHFGLGGYSQGAQVVGEARSPASVMMPGMSALEWGSGFKSRGCTMGKTAPGTRKRCQWLFLLSPAFVNATFTN